MNGILSWYCLAGAMDAWLDETNLKKAEKWVDKNWRQGKPLFKDDPEVSVYWY